MAQVRIEEVGQDWAQVAGAKRFAVPLRNLLRRPGRSIMTGAAVAIAMALMVSMFSVKEGIRDSVIREIIESNEDLVVIPEQGMVEGAHSMAGSLTLWEQVEFATPVLLSTLSMRLPTDDPKVPLLDKTVFASGIVPGEFWKLMGDQERDRFAGGNWFNESDDPHYDTGYTDDFTGELLLSDNLENPFGKKIKVGDTLEVSQTVGGPTYTMRVVGFFDTEFTGEGYYEDVTAVIMHLSELQNITQFAKEDLADWLSISMTSEAIEEGALKNVVERIEEDYPEYADDILTKEDQLDLLRKETALVEMFYVAVGSVSMLIGLLFVATIMIVSVLERTREIGMLRAIGISRRSIFMQILVEMMVLVFVGAIVGIAPGYYGAVWAAGNIGTRIGHDIALGFSTMFVAQVMLAVLAVGALFAMYPARIAMRMNIVQAINMAA